MWKSPEGFLLSASRELVRARFCVAEGQGAGMVGMVSLSPPQACLCY